VSDNIARISILTIRAADLGSRWFLLDHTRPKVPSTKWIPKGKIWNFLVGIRIETTTWTGIAQGRTWARSLSRWRVDTEIEPDDQAGLGPFAWAMTVKPDHLNNGTDWIESAAAMRAISRRNAMGFVSSGLIFSNMDKHSMIFDS